MVATTRSKTPQRRPQPERAAAQMPAATAAEHETPRPLYILEMIEEVVRLEREVSAMKDGAASLYVAGVLIDAPDPDPDNEWEEMGDALRHIRRGRDLLWELVRDGFRARHLANPQEPTVATPSPTDQPPENDFPHGQPIPIGSDAIQLLERLTRLRSMIPPARWTSMQLIMGTAAVTSCHGGARLALVEALEEAERSMAKVVNEAIGRTAFLEEFGAPPRRLFTRPTSPASPIGGNPSNHR